MANWLDGKVVENRRLNEYLTSLIIDVPLESYEAGQFVRIGLQDDEWGEIVTAAVVLHPGQNVSESDLIEYCREKLSSYKKPKKIFFMDELPKNPSGKILKRDLRLNLN